MAVGATLSLILATAGRQAAGWEGAAITDAGVALLPLAFRDLERRFPGELTRFGASFLPATLGVILVYGQLNPVCDLFQARLADPLLVSVDRAAFGLSPAHWLAGMAPTWLESLLACCYTTYYVWPLAIGFSLFRRGQAWQDELDGFTFGFVAFMFASFVGYLAVPAIGPRFYLAHELPSPVPGTLGAFWDGVFRGAPFFRDCFPSGHTGLTLFCLYKARSRAPGVFRWMWLPSIGLIAATVVCRFHYGVDLVAGAALAALVIALTDSAAVAVHAVEPTQSRREPSTLTGTVGYPSPARGPGPVPYPRQ